MAIYLYVIDNQEHKLITIGSLDESDIISLVKEAKGKYLKCLSFIDYIGYTIFNNEQIQEMKLELICLTEDKKNTLSLEFLINAITQASENSNYYVMFEGE